MPSRSKDRVFLCSFTFSDGRHCRTPRAPSHASLCYFHARRETQARAVELLGRDISHFFSGDFLSACDLSSAIGRLFIAVAEGHVKPRAARTLAYLAQTLVRSIQISQHEYINAFGPNSWREAVRTSVTSNYNYLFPDSAPADPPKADSDHNSEDLQQAQAAQPSAAKTQNSQPHPPQKVQTENVETPDVLPPAHLVPSTA